MLWVLWLTQVAWSLDPAAANPAQLDLDAAAMTPPSPVEDYRIALSARVQRHWEQNLIELPFLRLERGDYTSRAQVVLNADGTVDAVSITKPSKVPLFDQQLEWALETAAPFPEVPKEALVDGKATFPLVSTYFVE